MKTINRIICSALLIGTFSSCADDIAELKTTDAGPVMNVVSADSNGYFGGVVDYSVSLDDPISLSTLTAQILFDDEVVAEEVTRTSENGTYEGSLSIPYTANTPNGDAVLRFVGQNTQFGTTTIDQTLSVSRATPATITFNLDGAEYTMNQVEGYNYAVTDTFDQKAEGYITIDDVDGKGSTVNLGYSSTEGSIVAGSTEGIPFSNAVAGEYEISINILTFAASPFLSLSFAGIDMTMVDSNNYTVITTFTQGSEYEMSGISDFADWDVDCDFFERADANFVTFLPVTGLYKVTANFEHSYLRIEPMASTADYASYSDGGAVWLIGDLTVGKPTLSNGYSWNTDMALALAQMSSNTYQITFTAGVSMSATSINFKFFHQKGWGYEFGGGTITSNSAIITASESDGNINLSEGYTFDIGGIYTFTLDVSSGTSAAIITVEKSGEVEFDSAGITVNGTEMTMVDLDNYSLDIELTQNEVVSFAGDDMFSPAWINPDFFGADYTLVPLSGWYRVLLNVTDMTIDALPIDSDGSLKTLADDGSGAIYFIGYGIGSPYVSLQPGWESSAGVAVPEYSDKVYVMRAMAGAESSTTYGERFRADSWYGNFYTSRNWGDLGAFTLAEGTEALLSVSGGNIELASGVTLEEGANYQLTVDCTEGKDFPVITFEKVE